MAMKSKLLTALWLVAIFASTGAHAEVQAQCDGRQMYDYVDVALLSGGGVVNVANDPEYGSGSASIALKSQNMRLYSRAVANIREHDLNLARRGCTTLVDGPTQGMMSSLRQLDAKIRALLDSQYDDRGILTDGFGEVR